MKDVLSAAAVFEFAMFGIMVLFLSFCGFFTLKHCCYMWRKKKRKRHDDSLESILDLLYNEDYYYLESSTPYLPPAHDECSSEQVEKTGDEQSNPSFVSAPDQGRSVKWTGTEKISMDKYKVCPQTVKSETRGDVSSQRKLRRQTKFLANSSENVPNKTEKSKNTSTSTFYEVHHIKGGPNPRPHSLNVSSNFIAKTTEKGTSVAPEKTSPNTRPKQTSISIRKMVATSKFIGAAHRAKKQLRMQSRFQPGTFRFREETSREKGISSSFEKQSSPDSEGRHGTKRRVNFLDPSCSPRGSRSRGGQTQDSHARNERHKSKRYPSSQEKHGQKIGSPHSAFKWLPRPHATGSSDGDGISGGRHDDMSGTDVEELCQEYERLERTRYAEMLKKAKSLGRENMPFFHRKNDS